VEPVSSRKSRERIIGFFTENNTKGTNTLSEKNAEFFMFQQAMHVVTAGILTVKGSFGARF
jgi:hypothetical protein